MMQYEQKFINDGARLIAGIDEAGRGPLAGPVVVAGVIMPMDTLIEGVDDSKKLSAKKRDMLYDKIMATATDVQIAVVENEVIDRVNILNATKQGMIQCIAVKLNVDVPTLSIIHGDALSYSIAAASIVAKVTRDRLMLNFDNLYPQYHFAKHKGYGTREHIELLKTFGPCPIHRKTFIGHFVQV